jgi:hypothetical protein
VKQRELGRGTSSTRWRGLQGCCHVRRGRAHSRRFFSALKLEAPGSSGGHG